MSHNCNVPQIAVEESGQEPLQFKLSGSQRKTAYALEKNVARLIEEEGIETVGFLTLTVGDDTDKGFRQVWSVDEGSKRMHSLISGFLSETFSRAVIVSERHASGAIHFHLIVACGVDIRSGFDFEAFLRARNARKGGEPDGDAERLYSASATPGLRYLWSLLRERLQGYGFGRAELTPVYSKGEALSRYVSKYVEKNLFNRRDEDKGKRLVRYMGWGGSQLKPNDFCWVTPKACEWRRKAEAIAAVGGMVRADVALGLGPKWGWRVSKIMAAVAKPEDPLFMAAWTTEDQLNKVELELRVHMSHAEWEAERKKIPMTTLSMPEEWIDEIDMHLAWDMFRKAA